jgi:hypothetical protein
MQRWQWTRRGFVLTGALAVMIVMGPAAPAAETAGDHSRPRTVVELTEDFYRTLRSEGTRTYATGSSDEYLRQIAVSSRFMVETNLQLLQQQKRIIQLLEALQQQPAKH